eukprot:gene4317-7673_t
MNEEENEVLSFRQKAPNFINIEESEPQQSTKPMEEIKKEETKETKPLKDEPMKMFFYYPKYLHPEAVALISQNLLNEWEEKEDTK